MKTLQLRILSVFIIVLIFSTTVLSNELVSLTTSISGGIEGSEDSFTPCFSFKGDEALFSTKVVTAADEAVTFVLASDFDDVNFVTFINKLTDENDDFLRVGHQIGKIKANVSNLESNWFNGELLNKNNISYITLTYSNIKFNSNGDDWTDFSYDLTLSIFGNDEVNLNPDYTSNEAFKQIKGFNTKKEQQNAKDSMIEKVTHQFYSNAQVSDCNKENVKAVKASTMKVMYLSPRNTAKVED